MAEDKKATGPMGSYSLIIVAKDLKLIENYCRTIEKTAEEKAIKISGVSRYPVKRLCITTRKSPCGNGSNTWDRFEMRMYKRSYKLDTTKGDLQELFKTAKNPPAVQVVLEELQ